jgi:hypothetical protein
MKILQPSVVIPAGFCIMLTLVSIGSAGLYGYTFGMIAMPLTGLLIGFQVKERLIVAALLSGLICSIAVAFIPRLINCYFFLQWCPADETSIIAGMSAMLSIVLFPAGVLFGKYLAK